MRFARGYYRKGRRTTTEFDGVKCAVRPLKELYGHTMVAEFGPISLRTVRQRMIDAGWSRGVVNQAVGRIKRIFKWAAAEELIPANVAHALAMVTGLRKGRTEAAEREPVQSIDDKTVDATLMHLPAVVADMVRFERFTGCRPAEVCMLRPCDVDRSGEVWTYTVGGHKTEHHGRSRIVFIGPKAQGVLLRYLARDARTHCFRPIDSESKRRAAQHAARVTPIRCGNVTGTNRKRRPRRQAGEAYTADSYRRAIRRACDKAFPAPKNISADQAKLTEWQERHRWSPNRLRHSAATEIRRRYGLEAAQVVLGHAAADVTQIYAERDLTLAARVAREVG